MAKKGQDLLYPLALRGEETGEAVRATSWTVARKKLARFERRFGSNYYLMNGVPYAENAYKYHEVMADPPSVQPNNELVHPASVEALKKQTAHLRRYRVE